MIYSLRGTLIQKLENAIVVECGGVGFFCLSTSKTIAALGEIGSEVFVFTHMSVKEDSMDLFAFATQDELECFKMIISVNGVGPKIGIALLSDFSPNDIYLFIASNDHKSLTAASGVGGKLAQRIVLELKDKIGEIPDSSIKRVETVGNAVPFSAAKEAIEALVALGCTQSEASLAVSRLDHSLPTDELIKQALKSLTK